MFFCFFRLRWKFKYRKKRREKNNAVTAVWGENNLSQVAARRTLKFRACIQLWTKEDSSGMSAGLLRTPANHITRKRGRQAVRDVWEQTDIPETLPGEWWEERRQKEKRNSIEKRRSWSALLYRLHVLVGLFLLLLLMSAKQSAPPCYVNNSSWGLISKRRSQAYCAINPRRNLAHEFHLMRKKFKAYGGGGSGGSVVFFSCGWIVPC